MRGEIPSYSVVGPGVAAFNVVFHPTLEDAVRLSMAYGADVVGRAPSINVLVLEMPVLLVGLFSKEDSVRWIESPMPRLSEANSLTRIYMTTDIVQAAPYSLDGTGVKVMLHDAGASWLHNDFQSRLTVRDGASVSAHSTHVAGTIGSSHSVDLYSGHAQNVTIESYAYEQKGGGQEFYLNVGDIAVDFADAINTYDVVIANSSLATNIETDGWPCEKQGNYGLTSALIDSYTRGGISGVNLMWVWANGNERFGDDCNVEGHGDYYSMGPPACAKNHIAVGSIDNDTGGVSYFSSWGPCDDGRLKPDVVAPGCRSIGNGGIISTSRLVNYSIQCGTSMAAPAVTGVAALMLQDYRVNFPLRGDEFLPSTLKALLIHNALDIEAAGPDYRSGYGEVRTKDTIDQMRKGNFWEADISDGETCTRTYKAHPFVDIKITIAWDDPPAMFAPTVALINDIDLELVDPLGTKYYPFTLDPDDPGAVAITTVADHLNNVEQIIVVSPMAGDWTVKIIGHDVPDGPQTVSVVGVVLIGDLNNDGKVNGADYLLMLASWGPCIPCAANCFADLNHDCIVDSADVLMLFANWGPC